MDFFAGSGTFGEAALELGREFILIDSNLEAIDVMRKRFAQHSNVRFDHHSNMPISMRVPRRTQGQLL
jgi:DNA modification methylase